MSDYFGHVAACWAALVVAVGVAGGVNPWYSAGAVCSVAIVSAVVQYALFAN